MEKQVALMTVEVERCIGEVAGEFMTRLIKQILRMRECLKNEGKGCEW